MDNTREKLIELIGSVQYGNGSLIGNNFQKGFIEKIADHLIANGVTLDNQVSSSKFIPVTERLPVDEELVLILCKNGAMFVGYCGKQYADFERRWRIKTALNSTKLLNLGRVTHWMPLPEPPKEEKCENSRNSPV